MSTANCADLDGDGLVDLVLGDTSGRVFWSRNEGSATAPSFTGRQPVQVGDGNLKVSHKSDPCPVDWDDDGVLDLLVHPNYADRFAEVLDRLHRESRMEVVTAFVEEAEEERRQAFERAGYRAVGRLEDCLRIGDEVFNLTIYEKRLGRSAG